MRFRVVHTTEYGYDGPIALGPHVVRLRPRCDATLHLLRHDLKVDPAPAGRSDHLDLHGNSVTRLWFSGATAHLRIESAFEAETTRGNPFDFLLEPGFARLPVGGPAEFAACRAARDALPAAVIDLSDRLAKDSGGDTLGFLSALNAHLFRTVVHDLRHEGDPYPPETTLALGAGACRDIAVLFLALCRAQGLAGRFVSGYQARSKRPDRHLHAWPEVYLPGGGWRGFDPTWGRAIADAHVALAAAPTPAATMLLEGSFTGAARARMTYHVAIEAE
jgi:transglutaminase-like putative cysteine protease